MTAKLITLAQTKKMLEYMRKLVNTRILTTNMLIANATGIAKDNKDHISSIENNVSSLQSAIEQGKSGAWGGVELNLML